MTRIFLALTPEKDLNDKIIDLKKNLKKDLFEDADIAWQKNDDHHLTINFVGPMEPEQMDEMYKGISEVKFISHLEIEITSVNFFPNEEGQLLVSMFKPTPQLQKLFERIDEVVTIIGFGSSLKNFRPHLTLGRFKDKNRPEYSLEEFSELSIKSRVNSIDVYETEFEGGKTVYSKLKSFEFSRS